MPLLAQRMLVVVVLSRLKGKYGKKRINFFIFFFFFLVSQISLAITMRQGSEDKNIL